MLVTFDQLGFRHAVQFLDLSRTDGFEFLLTAVGEAPTCLVLIQWLLLVDSAALWAQLLVGPTSYDARGKWWSLNEGIARVLVASRASSGHISCPCPYLARLVGPSKMTSKILGRKEASEAAAPSITKRLAASNCHVVIRSLQVRKGHLDLLSIIQRLKRLLLLLLLGMLLLQVALQELLVLVRIHELLVQL